MSTQQVTDEWVLVPREPTQAMLTAGRKRLFADMTGAHMGPNTRETYKAMLAAAPSAGEDAVKAEREACANLVEENQETIREAKEGTERLLSPRYRGNLTGLAYAAAIRARKP